MVGYRVGCTTRSKVAIFIKVIEEDLPMDYRVDHFFGFRAELGEGLIWDGKSERMLMTDIVKGRLIEFDIDSGSR